ncbi:TIGR03667 family PPOX class F420-dependent oxidoreductase [Amycolatopsis marina]|uniref:TIGR03667 family PPOX class F420-dependent oxidoreductase n=1 Tax=Amycolatopsis marina TaxID=490629 RepID=UPI000B805AA6|nr:TIGR03667 family PPOX class F420-dependent oxidoreductase [Amycolatopsis marina]
MTFEQTAQFRRRIADTIVWLTTVTSTGKPAPKPVWFVFDGESFLIFSEPGALKMKHIDANPNVALHFNIAPDGEDVLVVSGTAEVVPDVLPSTAPGYLDKYEAHYPRIGHDRDSVDATYSAAIRVTPTRSWGF